MEFKTKNEEYLAMRDEEYSAKQYYDHYYKMPDYKILLKLYRAINRVTDAEGLINGRFEVGIKRGSVIITKEKGV